MASTAGEIIDGNRWGLEVRGMEGKMERTEEWPDETFEREAY